MFIRKRKHENIVQELKAKVEDLQSQIEEISFASEMSPKQLISIRAGLQLKDRFARGVKEASLEDLSFLGEELVNRLAMVLAHDYFAFADDPRILTLYYKKQSFLEGSLSEDYEQLYAETLQDLTYLDDSGQATLQDDRVQIILSALAPDANAALSSSIRKSIKLACKEDLKSVKTI